MNKTQAIFDDAGRPAFAVIPWHEYERLTNTASDALLSDEELYDRANEAGEESLPIEVADRILAGDSQVRVYRNHRGMTQHELASAAGINPVYLSQIERRKRSGSTRTLAALAQALGVTVDDLICPPLDAGPG